MMHRRVLIPTYVNDIHAKAVEIALERKGHQATLWFAADFPNRQRSSISLDPSDPDASLSWEIRGPAEDLCDEPFDVVWFRRPTEPELPDDLDLHPGDRYMALRACNAHYRALWEIVAPDGFWVNSRLYRQRASAKPLQLREAVRAGLKIPPTLCSNDPERIRAFLRRYPEETIYKPFYSAQWRTEDGSALVFTTEVGVDDLPEDDLLQVSSGIFQQKVVKDHELRVLYMGGHLFSARLLSQDHPEAGLDWKLAGKQLGVLPGPPLPEEVARGCRKLMDRLQLVFGCLDFIVTPDGEHVFLEVNEMGQFLWIEEYNTDLLVLDTFCEFLLRGQNGFDGRPARNPVRFDDVLDEAFERIEEDRKIHHHRIFRQAADDTGRSKDGMARIAGPV